MRLSILRRRRLRRLLSLLPTQRSSNKLKQQLDTTTRQLDVTSQRLQLSELRGQLLEDRLRLQRIAKYGPGSEKLTSQQLELLELEPGVSSLEVAAEGEQEALPATPDKQKRKHPGRQTLPANLPRVERVIACTSEQCVCGGCGQSTTVIGYEKSEQLDVEPVKYFVLVTKREKRACKSCEERGVMAAPLPPRIIEKSLVSDQVIVDAIISKYSNHCPLYRQSVILLRDTGIDISRATIDGWVMRVGELLTPLVGVMRKELLEGTYIQADETPVDVQTRDGRSRNHPGYLWQYGTPGGTAIFEFRMGRGREGPMRFLAENSMRPVATGRRNWTHIGHEKAGPRVAAILSIVETCRRLRIPVREYLATVLPGSPTHPSSDFQNSLPPPGPLAICKLSMWFSPDGY
jgi:transposase